MKIVKGACVKMPDGRIGRARGLDKKLRKWKIRVKRSTSNSHEFIYVKGSELVVVDCPKGWMSIIGYNNYVKVTLFKMKEREKLNRTG
jgi:hypothetical protein